MTMTGHSPTTTGYTLARTDRPATVAAGAARSSVDRRVRASDADHPTGVRADA